MSQNPPTEPDSVPSRPDKNLFQDVLGFFFGYDFFISYATSDGRTYAKALKKELTEGGFHCFLDSDDYAKGDNWRQTGRRALRNTSRLVLVGTAGALASEPVLNEVKIYTGLNRRVIPIDLDGALTTDHSNEILQLIGEDVLRINEEIERLKIGPSKRVVNEINNSFDLIRQSNRRERGFAVAAMVFVVLAVLAMVFAIVAKRQTSLAEERTREVNRQLAKVNRNQGREARDIDKHIIKAAHYYAKASEASAKALDEDLSRADFFESQRLNQSVVKTIVYPYSMYSAEKTHDGNRVLLTSSDGHARLLDLISGTTVSSFKHGESIAGARLSGDETRLVTWGRGPVRIWDVLSGQRTNDLNADSVDGAVFNVDGSRLLTWRSDGAVWLWDLASGEKIIGFAHDHSLNGAGFYGNEANVITWGDEGMVQLWSVASGVSEHRLKHDPLYEDEAEIRGVQFNSDESRLLTWGFVEQAYLWNVDSGELVQKLGSWPNGAFFARDESLVWVWSSDGTAQLWDLASDKANTTLRHEEAVYGVKLLHDEQYVLTWSYDDTARFWKAADGKLLGTFDHKGGSPLITYDEMHLLTQADGTAQLWVISEPVDRFGRMRSPEKEAKLVRVFKHGNGIHRTFFTRDESRLMTWFGDMARLWQISPTTAKKVFKHEDAVEGAVFTNDHSSVLTWSGDGTARLWELSSGAQLKRFEHEGIYGACFNNNDSRILTWGYDGTTRVWDVVSATEQNAFTVDTFQSRVYGAHPCGDISQVLTWGNDGTVRVWDDNTGKPRHSFHHSHLSLNGAFFTSDESHVVSFGRDGMTRLWDVATGTEEKTFGPGCNNVVPNLDTSQILTWGDHPAATLWNLTTGKALKSFLHDDTVSGAMFLGDESFVVTWSRDGTARLWDAETGKALRTFNHGVGVRGVVVSEDESRLMTWGYRGPPQLWDVWADELAITLQPENYVEFEEQIDGAQFSRDGSRVLTWREKLPFTSQHGVARLWSTSSGTMIRMFEHKGSVTGGMFTDDESHVITWGDDGTVRLWDSAGFDIQHEQDILQLEIKTAFSIDDLGKYRVLSYDGWLDKKRRYKTLQAKE